MTGRFDGLAIADLNIYKRDEMFVLQIFILPFIQSLIIL
jgi:hypothetical protein